MSRDNYGEALRHLASILDKAQGVTCIGTEKQIDIGREVLKLRGILDEFQAIASRDEPVAAVTGYYGGHCVIEQTDRARLLPVGMALYSSPQAAVPEMSQIKPVAWRTMDCPPKEEDGTVLVWAENMPVSMGCCEDGYYVFTECEDLHNYFEGNEAWLREHWTLWMHLPEPCGKSLTGAHRIVSVELLADACCFLLRGYISAEVSEKLLAIIDNKEQS